MMKVFRIWIVVGLLLAGCTYQSVSMEPNDNASLKTEEAKVIALIKKQEPDLANFPQNLPAGGSIRTKKTGDIWSVTFITYGSGVPIIGSRCFMVKGDNVQKIEPEEPATGEVKTAIEECSKLLDEEKALFQ